MVSQKIFAILALAAAFLPATHATCYLRCRYLNDSGEWVDITHTSGVGHTFHIKDHQTKIGKNCKPERTNWDDAEIYSW
ncbi:hypothetical protein LZ30DRAFT_697601 [Colletotrichum cereale]|nr:hypothetical protein LZ30DRAFT_697601 [Colletotrichum cereale]